VNVYFVMQKFLRKKQNKCITQTKLTYKTHTHQTLGILKCLCVDTPINKLIKMHLALSEQLE